MNIALNQAAGRSRRAARRQQSSHQQTPDASRLTRRMLLSAGFCSSLGGVGVVADGLTMANALLAGVMLALFAVIQLVRPRRRQAVALTHAGPQAYAGALIRGGFFGLIFAALLALLAPLTHYLPTPEKWTDRDRVAVEQQMATLVAAGDFRAAANVAKNRLAGQLSKKWRGELEQRHIDLLVSAGEAAQTPEDRADYWKRAATVAAEYGRDARLPLALLAAADARRLHQQAESQFALQRDRRWRDFVIAVSRVMPPIARDAVLRTIETSLPKEYQPTGLSQAIVDNLLTWAEATGPLDEKAERLRTVIAECAKRKISPKLAQLQLAAVLQELERQAPVVLSAGTSAQLKAIRDENLPAMAYDVAIASAAGLPLEHLAGKDFVVLDAGQQRVPCEILTSVHTTGSEQSVLVLLDHSPSTELVRNDANAGVTAMTSAAPRGTQFRVLAFHDDVVAVTDWTDRFADIDSRLRTFKTSGSRTSIRRAMTVGVAELAQRSGRRLLVLFTDGKETTGEIVNSAELIAACREKSIRVMTIGLENPDLDEALLADLAAGTGGKYYAASRQEQLVDQFRSLQLKQSTPVHRVALLASSAMEWPLELTIGRGPHAARVSLPQR